jgi:sugar/nucleoside kinase (ribokinase family)
VILVAGDIMLDVLVLSALRAEEQSRGIMLRPGGSAANTAAWLARLGRAVTFAGCVGDDPVGALLASELSSHGVTTAIRQVRGSESGAVAVEIGEDGERLMRSARGANEALSPEDLRRAVPADLDTVHLTGYALLGPYGFEMLTAAAEIARSGGALLSFDPSSCGVIDRVGARRMLVTLEHCGVGLVLPNRPEAVALTGKAVAEDAAAELAAIVPAVIVKDSAAGAVWSDGRRGERVPTQSIAPVDCTGAGDAFNAGALAAVASGRSLDSACQAANGVAGQVILAYGGRPAS